MNASASCDIVLCNRAMRLFAARAKGRLDRVNRPHYCTPDCSERVETRLQSRTCRSNPHVADHRRGV